MLKKVTPYRVPQITEEEKEGGGMFQIKCTKHENWPMWP